MVRSTSFVCLLAVLGALLSTAGLGAAEYYLDAAAGGDGNAGTAVAPWKTWSHAQTHLVPGDTLHATGALGAVQMTSADPVGTAAQPITYRRWSGKPVPHITTLVFDGAVKDAYLVFDGFKFDPGYVASAGLAENNTVNLDGASHIVFDHGYFEGPKLAGATGDFAPYCLRDSQNPPTLTAGHPGNASYITVKNSTFSYSSVAIRLYEHYAYPAKLVRHWQIVDNDFAESAEDFITMAGGGGGDSVVARNVMHDQVMYRSSFHWPGTATGQWGPNYSWLPVTQDVTGASAIFYHHTAGRLHLLADDKNHLPARNTTHPWRLDADPQNIYFTPSGTGDSTHVDGIAIQGATKNVLIQRNSFEATPEGGQCLKLDYVDGQPEFITVENNLFFCPTASATYLILITGGSNTIFRHNTIYPGPSAPAARGLRFLEKTGGAWENLQFTNNIISGAVVSSGSVTSDYNLWLSAPPVAIGEGPHSITVAGLGAAGVVDPAAPDFQLLENSIARDKGDPAQAPGVTAESPLGVDYAGAPRDPTPDLGAYEHQGEFLQVQQWESIATHGTAGAMALAVSDQAVDSRAATTSFRITFSMPVNPATVTPTSATVVGQTTGPVTLPPGALALSGGNMVLAITLPAALGNDTWTVTLDPGITSAGGRAFGGDRDLTLRLIKGDVNASGDVTAADIVALRDRSGEAVTPVTCRWDVDLSGRIDGTDLLKVRSLLDPAGP